MKKGYIHLDGNCLNFSPENLFTVSINELREFHKKKIPKTTSGLCKGRYHWD